MALFDSGLSNISILIDVPFPSNVVSGPGVTVNKTNSVWSVQLDYPDLTLNTNPGALSAYFLAWWDSALQRYEQVRADVALGAVTGGDQRTPIGNANYSVLTTDRYIALTAPLTTLCIVTLPASSTVPGGRVVTIEDEVGAVSDASYVKVVPTGSDTIVGGSQWLLKTKYGSVSFVANGTNAWSLKIDGQRSPVADANYTATQGDFTIAYTSLTAARIVTLPAASAYPQGVRLLVIDESGSCSATNTITVTRAGSDTINGATIWVLNGAYAYAAVESNGSNAWTMVDASAPGTRGGPGDANYTVLPTDRYVTTTVALTAPRSWTLPAASSVAPGTAIRFEDAGRATTTTNTITIQRAGSDTIDKILTSTALGTSLNQGVTLTSDGVSNWNYTNLYGNLDGFAVGSTTPSPGAFSALTIAGSTSIGPAGALPLQGYLSGLTLSNDGTSPNTVIDVAAGMAQSDDNTSTMILASAFTKTTGAWAVGSGNGGLDTGAVAASAWYHVFLIRRTDTGVVDVLLSASATAPTMPANYTKKRRIGSILTDSSAHIIAFSQNGDEFLWAAPVSEIAGAAPPDTNAHIITITVPTGAGLKVNAILHMEAFVSSTAFATRIRVSPLDITDAVPSVTDSTLTFGQVSGSAFSTIANIRTTNGQVRYRFSSTTNATWWLTTNGWMDTRGR